MSAFERSSIRTASLLILVALLALVFFDLGPPLAFNDDWGMSWEARRLILNHHLQILPVQSALAIVQVFWSWLVTLGHPDQRLLRLSVVPLVLGTAYLVRHIALRLGASRAWAWVAAAVLLGSPVYMGLATSYMTDVPYLALLLATSAAGLEWATRGRLRMLCVALVFLAPLQRQIGAFIPLALTLALLRARKERELVKRDWVTLGAVWVAAGVASLGPILLHVAPATEVNRFYALTHLDPAHQLQAILFLPGQLGLFLLPFLAGVFFVPRLRGRRGGAGTAFLAAVSALALAAVAFYVWQKAQGSGSFFLGNTWTNRQLNWFGTDCPLPCAKPNIYPPFVFLPIEAFTLANVLVLFVWRGREWLASSMSSGRILAISLSAVHFVPLLLLQTELNDRYYLVAAAPLIPVLAAVGSSAVRVRAALGWAIASIFVGIVLYGVGEQDFEAVQAARAAVAQMAYRIAPPDRVDAGYELDGVNIEIPLYEKTGSLTGGLARGAHDPDLAISGPGDPQLIVRFAPRGDPRPGIDYWSLAPGRMVIARPDGGPR